MTEDMLSPVNGYVFSPLFKLSPEAPDTETKYQAAEQAEAKQGVP